MWELGLDQLDAPLDEHDLYAALDWLVARQHRIENKLAKKHLTMRYLFDPDAVFERYMPNYMEKYKQAHFGKFQEEITFDPCKKRPEHNYLKYKEL